MYKEVKDYETGQIIKVGETYRFAYLWSGDGDEKEIKDEENPIDSIIKITDLS